MTNPAPTPTFDPVPLADPPPAPPLPWLLAYRVLGVRLPEEYRPWVARDVTSKMFLTWRMGRTFVWYLALLGLYVFTQSLVRKAPDGRLILRLSLAALALSLLASGKTLVRRTLRWQRIDKRARPVAPKGLAVLDNRDAIALGLVLLVLFTGASVVYGHARRPRPVKVAKCEQPDGAVVDRIRLGLKNPRTKLDDPQQLTFGDRRLLAAQVTAPGQPKRTMLWIVEPEQVYELRPANQAAESPTTFDAAPRNRLDRALGPVIQRMAQCLGLRVGEPRS